MSFVEFLMEYYFYILAILIVLIVGVIGFLVDSKNKKKNDVGDVKDSSVGQVNNNINPLQNTNGNNVPNNEILNMQPMGGDTLVQNQVQPVAQNVDMSLNGAMNVNAGTIANENASVSLENNVLGMGNIDTNQNNSNIMENNNVVASVQPEVSNTPNLMGQVIQPVDVNNQMPVNNNLNNLSGTSDISTLQSVQPVMSNNTVNQMPSNGANFATGQTVVSSLQPGVSSTVTTQEPLLNAQPVLNDNMNQISNNVVPTSINDSNNAVINSFSLQPNMQNGIQNTSSAINQNNGMINNIEASQVNTNSQLNNVSNQNTNNMGQQVYTSNNSQPFDISSMFGNNQ